MDIKPVTLEGKYARLEPLALPQAEDLFVAAQSPEIWLYLPANPSHEPGAMREWISATLELEKSGTILPFAIIDRASGKAIGSTRYLDIQRANRGLEIGWTWLGRAYWRTAINTECKYLLLTHAFETLGAIRVQLKTDLRNAISQRAIERIGAVREGILRNHVIMPDGYYRQSVMFSIIDDEWPLVKPRLEEMLNGERVKTYDKRPS
ncbi:MAG TPA: GNAT family protein [Anaerolineae bacterium]